jgi:hypothetical protein
MSTRMGEEHALTARGTGLLLAVCAALIGYLWLFELRPRQGGAPAAPEAAPLLPVAPAAVARVEVEERGRRLTALRGEDGWSDPSGRPWRTDAVADLVATLGSLRPVMVVDPRPHDPSDYGLGASARRLEVATTADGRPVLALEVGERNPAWTGLYARRGGHPEVLLIGAVLGWELDKVWRGAPAK